MSKKSFTSANPAIAFISSVSEESPVIEKQAVIASISENKIAEVPMKRNPEYIETKSKRVQMLMQPSLHTALKQVAAKQGISVNEAMHEILKQYVDELNHWFCFKCIYSCICVYVYKYMFIDVCGCVWTHRQIVSKNYLS